MTLWLLSSDWNLANTAEKLEQTFYLKGKLTFASIKSPGTA